MKCLACGHSDEDSQAFIDDYRFDEKEFDEVAVYKCPKCGNDVEDEIVEE